jgi:Ni,Fe-hydrogenase III small subunit
VGIAVLSLLRKIASIGRIAEPAPPGPEPAPPGLAQRIRALRGSAQVRCVDAGSCNGCEIEIGQAFGPVYDAERHGGRIVASPRHADVLLVTGPVTRNMAEPLRRTYRAAAEPRVVVAVGDCAIDCGEFAGAYGVVGAVAGVVPVDLQVPGCPPTPDQIVAALRRVTGR